MALSREIWINLALVALLLAIPFAALHLGNPFYVTLATRMAILGLAAVGLNIALGLGGLVSFGHAAFFGVGGYAAGILAAHAFSGQPLNFGLFAVPGTSSMPVIWLVALLAGGLLAAAIGAISLRTSGVYFIMITLAFAQMTFYFAISWPAYGGEDGLSILVRNRFPGVNTMVPLNYFLICYGLLVAALLLFAVLRSSRFGAALQAARQNEVRVASVGIAPFRIRLAAFVISGAITALAGALYADLNRFVSPSMLSWHMSGEFIVLIILGGVGRLAGPVAGAMLFVMFEFILGGLTERWQLFLGLVLLGVVLFARGGLIGLLAGRAHVSLDLRPGEIHALIGPNGAGKSTLIHQIAGTLRPDSGEVEFLGQPVGHLGVAARARLGLGRSFQVSSLAPDFSALRNVMLAVQSRQGSSFRFFRPVMRDASLVDPAMEALERVGLKDRAHIPAAELSHGERRQLEIAIALALGSKAFLLDEPMAGMGPEGSRRLTGFLDGLRREAPILLVEHDMDAVFALADRVSVLVYGRIIASGRVEDIRNDAEVRRAYLGDP